MTTDVISKPVPNSSFEVAKNNLEVLDKIVNQQEGVVANRDGYNLTPLPVLQDQLIASVGFLPVSGSFQAGGRLENRNDVLLNTVDNNYYSWGGEFPKIVTVGSTPITSGGLGMSAWYLRQESSVIFQVEQNTTAIANLTEDVNQNALNINGKVSTADLADIDSTVLIAGIPAKDIVNSAASSKAVDGIKGLLDTTEGVIFNVKGFYAGKNIGGGRFMYSPNTSRSLHNGCTVIAPPALSAWTGAITSIDTLFNWTGSGDGCFIRLDDGLRDASICGVDYSLDHSQHVPLQQALNVIKSVTLSVGNIRLDETVFIPSDRELIGSGSTFGGTIIRAWNSKTAIKFGTVSNPRHTRCKLKSLRFASRFATDRTLYMVDAFRQADAPSEGEAFMNNFDDLVFGDISAVDAGNQMNGMRIFGTANIISNCRFLRMDTEAGLEDVTGIGIFDSGANTYINLQNETRAAIVLRNSRSKFTNLHSERSLIRLINSSWCKFDNMQIVDGFIELDEKSNCNTFDSSTGANAQIFDSGLFNSFRGVNALGAEHGATSFGLYEQKSIVPLFKKATSWDSEYHRVYRMPTTGTYFCAVLLKNRMGATVQDPQVGSFELYNISTLSQLFVGDFSLLPYGATQQARNNSSDTRSFCFVFDAAENNELVFRKLTGNYAIISTFISPIENPNPRMINGSAWGVSGAPSLSGVSAFVSLKSAVPYIHEGKYRIDVPVNNSFSVVQYYTPKTALKKYCAVIKGTWTGNMRLLQHGGAHDGSRISSTFAGSGPVLLDGKRMAVLYFTAEDMDTQLNRSSISFGTFANQITSSFVEIDFCAVFPIE